MNKKYLNASAAVLLEKPIKITKPTAFMISPKKTISKNIDHCCGILIRTK